MLLDDLTLFGCCSCACEEHAGGPHDMGVAFTSEVLQVTQILHAGVDPEIRRGFFCQSVKVTPIFLKTTPI